MIPEWRPGPYGPGFIEQDESCFLGFWAADGSAALVAGSESVDDCRGGALVDTCAAVDAFGSVDDCDVIAGDSSLGAYVDACSTCNTLGFFD